MQNSPNRTVRAPAFVLGTSFLASAVVWFATVKAIGYSVFVGFFYFAAYFVFLVLFFMVLGYSLFEQKNG